MSVAPLVLVDPPRTPFWPLAATRPVADLLAGTRSFRDRWEERFGGVAVVVSEGAPPFGWPDPAGGVLVALSTWVPPPDWTPGSEPCEHRSHERAVAWRLDPGPAAELADDPPEGPDALRGRLEGLGLPERPSGGILCESIWALVAANPDLVRQDAADFAGEGSVSVVDPGALLGRAEDLRVGKGVAVGPFVVLDARDGPIVLDRDVRIEPHSVLRGPLYVGPESVVLGGEIGRGTSIGPTCKVRGEVEQSVFQGFDNKAHDGFVGHSAIGSWVNLGAGTITSDLKNTYGPVRVEDPGGRTDTGLLKAGAFLGDHVRTGIGTLLTTGARIGVGSHVFGGRGVSPARLRDFTWHDGEGDGTAVRWEPFERGLRAAMARRGREPSGTELDALRALHAARGGAS